MGVSAGSEAGVAGTGLGAGFGVALAAAVTASVAGVVTLFDSCEGVVVSNKFVSGLEARRDAFIMIKIISTTTKTPLVRSLLFASASTLRDRLFILGLPMT